MRSSARDTPDPPLIAIGASAGGIEALRQILPTLPYQLPAAVAIVVHRPPVQEDERLAAVLSVGSPLPVATARDGDAITAGRAYICPAGVHLAVEPGAFRLGTQAKENGSRPAIDVLFRTAAHTFGRRVAGVVLSGMLDDGTAGLAAIKVRGGHTVVQDPDDAAFADMPRNAMESVAVDAVLPAARIGAALVAFAHRAAGAQNGAGTHAEGTSAPSLFSCPDCGGVLSEIDADGVVRFRCRVGHAYSPRTLFTMQEEGLEEALWAALRALVERTDMSERLARRSRDRGFPAAARRFEEQAADARRRAETVRAAMARPRQAVEAAEAAGAS